MACIDADDREYHFKSTLRSANVLLVDSLGLFDTITTLHEGKDYRLRQSVQNIWKVLAAEKIHFVSLTAGIVYEANALRKRNPQRERHLQIVCKIGCHTLSAHTQFELKHSTGVVIFAR